MLSCSEIRQDYYHLPAFDEENRLQAVIEIPAGTNLKNEYRPERNRFLPDSLNGQLRYVDFLPYPANYGFIPSTKMSESEGGDGDALDVLVIAESLPLRTVLPVIPIATLRLSDDGELDTKIIAVPADPSRQVIQATNYQDFAIRYDAARQIIEQWFLSYKGVGRTKLLGWNDEKYALREIRRWALEKEE